MPQKSNDLTGKIYGNLKVLSRDGKSAGGDSLWRCECLLCGNETVVLAGNLTRGHTKSCGCLRHRKKPDVPIVAQAEPEKSPIKTVDPMQRECARCRKSFAGKTNAKYCENCRGEVSLERDRKYARVGSARPLGSTDTCVRCGAEYTVEGGLQKYCPDCKEAAYREADRIGGMKYYEAKKDEINPNRKEGRKRGLVPCEVCGKLYEKTNSQLTCSDECKKIRKDQKRREWERAQRPRGCEICGRELRSTHKKTKYCEVCAKRQKIKKTVEATAARREKAIGETRRCERCLKEYTAGGARQKYCERCAETARRNSLKKARNPDARYCIVCGKEVGPRASYCEDCKREKAKEYQRKYIEENAEKIKGYQRKYRDKNHEKIKESQRKFREEKPEKIKEHQRKYYLTVKKPARQAKAKARKSAQAEGDTSREKD